MSHPEPASLTAQELLRAYRSEDLRADEVIAASYECLSDIGRAEGIVLALADPSTISEASQESTRRWRAGEPRPLEGIPVGIKDIIATADMPTTGGSAVLGDALAGQDASCVTRLRDNGAIVMAKLATSEFAAGQPDNRTFGRVTNPWDVDRWTGGSSTGSGAALARRLLPLAIGTDTGGSIRVPSAWCGTTGLKPTFGRVSCAGVLPLSWTLDHVGPMARTARDCGLLLAAIAGSDPLDPGSTAPAVSDRLVTGPWCSGTPTSLAGLRIGAVGGWFTEVCDGEVLSAWRVALEVLADAGAVVVPVELPSAHLAFEAGWKILMAEAASLHEPHLGRLGELDPGFVARMMPGREQRAIDYLRALRIRPVVFSEAMAAFESLDALCTIGIPGTAPRFDQLTVEVNAVSHPMQAVHSRATMFGNMTGLPALMCPSGFDRKNLPTAVQFIGRPFDEATIIDVGGAFQERTTHHLASAPQPVPTERSPS